MNLATPGLGLDLGLEIGVQDMRKDLTIGGPGVDLLIKETGRIKEDTHLPLPPVPRLPPLPHHLRERKDTKRKARDPNLHGENRILLLLTISCKL